MKRSSFFFVHDLNSFSLMGDHMHTFSAGDGYVCRSTCILPSDDLSASEGVQGIAPKSGVFAPNMAAAAKPDPWSRQA